ALAARINLRYRDDGSINIAVDETTNDADIDAIVAVFAKACGVRDDAGETIGGVSIEFPRSLARTSAFLTHPVFNTHHSETEMMRYIRSLERKDIGLDTSMIPLGSC